MLELRRCAKNCGQKYSFSVFPCRPRGKEPITQHGCKDATRDQKQIDFWWNKYPSANIGVATGPISNIFVLDVDGEVGLDSIKELEKKHGLLPKTPISITGKGQQYFFRHPKCELKNRVRFAPGLDIRA